MCGRAGIADGEELLALDVRGRDGGTLDQATFR
jgi:hypothetical protein